MKKFLKKLGRKNFWILSVVNISILGIFLIAWFYLFLFQIPVMEEVFKQLGAELPLLTQFIISVSQLLVNFWFFLIPLLIVIIILISVGAAFLMKRLEITILIPIYIAVLFLEVFGIVIFMALFTYLPFYSLGSHM